MYSTNAVRGDVQSYVLQKMFYFFAGPYIRRINDDAREDEMEDNMQAVGSMLGNLKNMAQDMGGEIERQNKQLHRINNKVW